MSQYIKKNDPTKMVVCIVDEQETFYQLSDGAMIKKEIFHKYYESVNQIEKPTFNTSKKSSSDLNMDPDAFFLSSSVLKPNEIDKIKNVDSSKVPDNKMPPQIVNKPNDNPPSQQMVNESLVQRVENIPIPNNTNTDVSQYKVYENDDDAYNDFIKKGQVNQPTIVEKPKNIQQTTEIDQLFEDEKIAFGEIEAIKRRDIRLKRNKPVINEGINNEEKLESPTVEKQIDPTEIMFKSFKRNHPISVTIKFEDKIGNPDFVKMMMENMDGDIVGYYKKLIMSNIINNIKHIEDEVEKCIKKEIFGDEVIKEDKPKRERKPRNPKTTKL